MLRIVEATRTNLADRSSANRQSETVLSPGSAGAEEQNNNPADDERGCDQDANFCIFGKIHERAPTTD